VKLPGGACEENHGVVSDENPGEEGRKVKDISLHNVNRGGKSSVANSEDIIHRNTAWFPDIAVVSCKHMTELVSANSLIPPGLIFVLLLLPGRYSVADLNLFLSTLGL